MSSISDKNRRSVIHEEGGGVECPYLHTHVPNIDSLCAYNIAT